MQTHIDQNPRIGSRTYFLLLLAVALCCGALAAPAKNDAPGAEANNKKDASADTKKDEKTSEVKLTPEAVRRYGIRTGVAKKHKLASSFTAPGRVSLNSEEIAVVGSAVQGRVADLKARVGDLVKKGDNLLIVESPELGEAQSDYLQKRASLTGAQALIEPSRSAAQRARNLYEQSQGISLTELQKREVDYATAQNSLLVAQAAADAAMNKLALLGLDGKSVEQLEATKKINARYSIVAPIAGRVLERTVSFGELVKPDREKLVVLADMTTLWVLADVPESRLKEISLGTKATVTVGAANDQPYIGTISNIGILVDPNTRSVPVRIEVKGDALLKPGMFAQVELSSRGAGENADESVLSVPDSAVQTVDGSTAVFMPVKDQPNTYAVRMVSVGPSIGGMFPIISGLEENERIVTAGTFILKADLGKASAKDED